MGIALSPAEMFEVFGAFDATEHATEAERRWGETGAFWESNRRTSAYTKDDWKRMKAAGKEAEQRMLRAMRAGQPATGAEAMDAAEAHRRHIDRWFYDCGHPMHRGLAEMYVADPRFSAHYDDQAPGLVVYVHDAIHANADRADSR